MGLQKKETTHISIMGSCVPRDTFEICKNADGYFAGLENSYTVDRFIQSISPVSAIFDPIDETTSKQLICEAEASGAANFDKRNFMLDVTKTWRNYLSEVKSDWLIIDLSTARLRLFEFENSIITEGSLVRILDKHKALSEDSLLSKLKLFNTIDVAECDQEYLINAYSRYFDELLAIYPQEKIIVLGIEHNFSFVDEVLSKVELLSYSIKYQQQIENNIINFAYSYAKEYMPRAHFIDPLPVSICDRRHKWGMMGLHYMPDTYLYFFRCIDYITHSNDDRSFEKEHIMQLQIDFSKKMFLKYSVIANKNLEEERNKLSLKHGVSPGVYVKNGITLTISDDFSYTVSGEATNDVVFYLISSHKNPLGGWASRKEDTEPGVYKFVTGTRKIEDKFFIQLLLTDSINADKRWITGDFKSVKFRIHNLYDYRLVRLVVRAGVSVNERGKLFLEKIE